jgi:hypothetical protein
MNNVLGPEEIRQAGRTELTKVLRLKKAECLLTNYARCAGSSP